MHTEALEKEAKGVRASNCRVVLLLASSHGRAKAVVSCHCGLSCLQVRLDLPLKGPEAKSSNRGTFVI